jgi:2-methylcitrate dehydratase
MRDTENTPKRASVPCYGEERKAVRVEYHRGHFKNPMSDAEMEEKFRSLARKHLPAERVDALLRQLWALEDMPKAGALIEMTKV